MNRFNIMFEAVKAGVSGDTEYSLWLENEVISLREKVRRLTAEAARAAITAHPPERRATGAEPHVGQVAVNTPKRGARGAILDALQRSFSGSATYDDLVSAVGARLFGGVPPGGITRVESMTQAAIQHLKVDGFVVPNKRRKEAWRAEVLVSLTERGIDYITSPARSRAAKVTS
jgi:hypothetical protein